MQVQAPFQVTLYYYCFHKAQSKSMDYVILELDFVPTPSPPTDEHTSSSLIPLSTALKVATRRIKKEPESVPASHPCLEEPKVEKKIVTRSSTAAVEAHRPTETPISAPGALGAPGVQIVLRPYSIMSAVQEQRIQGLQPSRPLLLPPSQGFQAA